MSDWKEVIVGRIRDKEEKSEFFDILSGQVERILESLISELRSEYHVNAKVETIEIKNIIKWVVTIEDQTKEIFPDDISKYFKKTGDIKEALITIMLDQFTFDHIF